MGGGGAALSEMDVEDVAAVAVADSETGAAAAGRVVVVYCRTAVIRSLWPGSTPMMVLPWLIHRSKSSAVTLSKPLQLSLSCCLPLDLVLVLVLLLLAGAAWVLLFSESGGGGGGGGGGGRPGRRTMTRWKAVGGRGGKEGGTTEEQGVGVKVEVRESSEL